ncbi:DUF6090 family protein [Salinimicrobium catena]|uniref:DUF6090 family protein n=1 Tax=Salinimicrobium catena TaxID=390640 RepID=UPI002FE4F801
MKNHKIGRYLQYAIGEIILVVAGILIALYINNYNQQEKKKERVRVILEEIQNDLQRNIWESEELIEFYYRKDSIIWKVINDELTRQDYIDHSFELGTLLTNPYHMKIYTNGYVNLSRNISDIPLEYRHLLGPLNEIYVNDKYEIDKFDERMNYITDRFHDHLSQNYTWFLQWGYGEMNDTIINYFLNDDYYKNSALTFGTYGANLRQRVREFRWDAIDAYNTITDILDNKPQRPDFIPHDKFHYPREKLDQFTGIYLEKNEEGILGYPMKFHIVKNNDRLQLVSQKYLDTVPLYIKAPNRVYTTTGEIEFLENENKQINGFRYEWESDTIDFKRIKNRIK